MKEIYVLTRNLDKNRDGIIDFNDINSYYKNDGLQEAEIRQIFSKMDLETTGIVKISGCCEQLARQIVEQNIERNFKTQVVIRFRTFLTSDEETTFVAKIENKCTRLVLKLEQQKEFIVDRVFHPSDQQDDIIQALFTPILYNIMQGYNITFVSTGQERCGKTYTAFGQSTNPKFLHSGLFSKIIEKILAYITATLDDYDYAIKFSCYEVRSDDKIMDLIGSGDWKGLEISKSDNNITIQKLSQEPVTSDEEIYSMLDKALSKRKIESTIFAEVVILRKDLAEENSMILSSRVTFIDIAKQELIKKIYEPREDTETSKLLVLLSSRVKTNCLPYIIMNCSPVKEHLFEHTLPNLEFAQNVSLVMCKAVKNEGEQF
jgi:hypothetical protein